MKQSEAKITLTIKEWHNNHPRYADLTQIIEQEKQTGWVNFSADWHQSSHILVATRGETIVGFLRYVVQEIGPDMDCPPIKLEGRALTESKILAFGVPEVYRRQGIGRALQSEALRRAKDHGCHQVRSRNSGHYSPASHQLKLSMGFAVHPTGDETDKHDVYFVKPVN